jgi:hypothetical protein
VAPEVLTFADGGVKMRMRRPHEEGRTKYVEFPHDKKLIAC